MAEEQGGGGHPPESEREIIERICHMRRAGLGYQKIGKLLGLPTSTVFRLAKQHCEGEGEGSSREQEGQEAASAASSELEEREETREEEGEEEYEPSPGVDKVILESSIEIARKIVLDPKIIIYYDWFRKKYGFEGDLAEFLRECVYIVIEKLMGYKLAIVKVGREDNG